jgi:hypothetical protein
MTDILVAGLQTLAVVVVIAVITAEVSASRARVRTPRSHEVDATPDAVSRRAA